MKILLVEDHALVRAGFRRVIADAFTEASFGEVGTAPEAIEAVRAEAWDLVVLDISLDGKSGLDVLSEIRCIAPSVRVLVMTMYGEEEYAFRAFRSGASGYITKASAPEELVNAVKKVVSGGLYVSTAMAENLAASLLNDAAKPLHETLSSREFQVFRMLASGLTVKAIGAELHISHKTVSTYRTRVLDKMQMHSTAELIRYAHRTKLVD